MKLKLKKNILAPYLKFLPKKNIILSIFSGFLFFFTAPPFDIWLLGFIFLIPMLIIREEETSFKKIFFYGWLNGIIMYIFGFYWLTHTIQVFGQLPMSVSVLLFIMYSVVFALKFGIFFWLGTFLEKIYNVPAILSFGSAIILVELFFPELFPFFLGNSQLSNTYFIQIIDIVGIRGMSLILVLINYLLYRWLLHREKKMILFFVSLVFIIYSYGFLRTIQIDNHKKTSQSLNVGLIQPDTPFLPRLTYRDLDRITGNVRSLTDQLIQNSAERLDLIVWPESATPFSITGPSNLGKNIRDFMISKNTFFLFNETDFEAYREGRELYSVATLLNPQGEVVDKYHKIYLLPFGEFMPLSGIFPSLKEMFPQVGNFKAGNRIINLSMAPDIQITPQICYESLYPNLIRKFIKKGGDIIVNLTNDKWFGKTAATFRHLWLLAPRAIENRVPIIRATNSGTSAIIDQKGEIISGPTAIYTQSYLAAKVFLIDNIFGLYTYIGDSLLFILLFYTLYILFMQRRKVKS
jgi:apolipoprotein N-acyltransferase